MGSAAIEARFFNRSEELIVNYHLALDFVSMLFKDYESPIIVNRGISLIIGLVETTIPHEHKLNRYLSQALDGLIVQIVIKHTQQGKTNS